MAAGLFIQSSGKERRRDLMSERLFLCFSRRSFEALVFRVGTRRRGRFAAFLSNSPSLSIQSSMLRPWLRKREDTTMNSPSRLRRLG